MHLTRTTTSLCPTCYAEIPATIIVSVDGVFMEKECCVHGKVRSMVERDPIFYSLVQSLGNASIYGGYFVDVTRRCNLKCKYCFYPTQKQDPDGLFSIDRIVQDCKVNAHNAPFILTGGEPTMREDLPELITRLQEVGPVELVTNGTKLANPEYFQAIASLLLDAGTGIASINISIHHDATDSWRNVIENARANSVKLESALIVIDSKEDFLKALDICRETKDVVQSFRLKAATKLWNEAKPQEKVFTSDMLNWLQEIGGAELITNGRNNKTSFVNVAHDGMFLMLVSWYDASNVDLADINCAPYYRARNGEVLNLVTACLVNEGVDKGFVRGVKT